MTLLRIRAAASRLGIGYSTLKQWIYAGRVRTSVTVGGHHRIAEAEIQRLSVEPPPQRRSQKPPPGRTAIAVLGDSNRWCGRIEEVRCDGLVAQIGLRVGGSAQRPSTSSR